MLLRAIQLTPWCESPNNWLVARVDLSGGAWLTIMYPTDKNGAQKAHPDKWRVYYNKRPGPIAALARDTFAHAGDRVDHLLLDEFTAQCVLDHYVQLHNNPTE